MRFEALWRVALVQLLLIGLLSIAGEIIFSHSFFVDWGWLVGPLAWLGCAVATAWIVGLPRRLALQGAVVSAIAGVIFAVVGAHWLGVVVAIGLFAVWCAREGGMGAAWS